LKISKKKIILALLFLKFSFWLYTPVKKGCTLILNLASTFWVLLRVAKLAKFFLKVIKKMCFLGFQVAQFRQN
jgi:hypothetical protein